MPVVRRPAATTMDATRGGMVATSLCLADISDLPLEIGSMLHLLDGARLRFFSPPSQSRSAVVGLQAAALEPGIDPGRHFRPQTDFYREQRVHFEAAQLPTLLMQLRERSPWRASELVPQLLICQQAADDPFNRSM